MNTYTPRLPFVTWNGAEQAHTFNAETEVGHMVAAYLEAAVWADKPDDEDWSDANWSTQAIDLAYFDCCAFLHLARSHINDWTMEQLGHDFYLTRNGHGAGFWDRDFGTKESRDTMTDLSKIFGEACPYEVDGFLYLE